MVNMPRRIQNVSSLVHFPRVSFSLSKVIKPRAICLFSLSFFPSTPSEERQLCHLFYISSEFYNFRVPLL